MHACQLIAMVVEYAVATLESCADCADIMMEVMEWRGGGGVQAYVDETSILSSWTGYSL
jgi:hypothetical protein